MSNDETAIQPETERNPGMKKRMFWMLFAVALLFGAIYGYHLFGQYMMQKYLAGNSRPPATVTAMQVKAEMWQKSLRAVGTLRAVRGVAVSAEIGGQVTRVAVKSGQPVKQGDLLVELNHADDDALLASLKADARLARISYNRDEAQLKARAISQARLDQTAASLAKAQAAVARQQALIAKKRITAPFNGRIGILTLNPGRYLQPAETITTLEDSSRLFVDFHLPQRFLADLKPELSLHISSDAFPDRTFDGHIHAVSSAVDIASRNVQIEGLIDNTEQLLNPGMFVRISVDRGAPASYLTIPQTAIGYNAYGATLFIAEQDTHSSGEKAALQAKQVFVTTGDTRGDQVAIISGISEGDMVVTSGMMKLKNGTPLIIDNSVLPANAANPAPQER